MGHHSHGEDIDVYLVPDALGGDLVEDADVGDADVVDEDGDVEAAEGVGDAFEELGAICVDEVGNDALGLDGRLRVRGDLLERLLHLGLVARHHGDVEAQGGQLLAESEADAVAAAGDDCP